MMLLHNNCGGRIQIDLTQVLDMAAIPNIGDNGPVFSIVKIATKSASAIQARYVCRECGKTVPVQEILEVCNECLGSFPVTELEKISGQAGAYCSDCSREIPGPRRSLAEVMQLPVDIRNR